MVNRGKAHSLGLVAIAYVVAVAAGAAWLLYGPSATGRLWLDAFTADVIATLVIFVFSRAYRNSSFYDAYWSVIPPLLLIYWWAAGPLGLDSLRCWLVKSTSVLFAMNRLMHRMLATCASASLIANLCCLPCPPAIPWPTATACDWPKWQVMRLFRNRANSPPRFTIGW